MPPKICQFPHFDDWVPESTVFGKSEAMQSLRTSLCKVAATSMPILIQGESGTGKNIIARTIHNLSPWKDGPFVNVNCRSILGTLESNLFSYEKGAILEEHGKSGRVQKTHRGTLFLDEISELDLALQSKLLRFLQDGQLWRIDEHLDRKAQLRVVCTTSRLLQLEMENGTFRQDLFYRINVANFRLPPLRERRDDIEDLVHHFLERHNRKHNCRTGSVSGKLLNTLQKYHWPGNIRELENLIESYVILGSEDMISKELVARKEFEFLNPEINLDGPISLKKLSRRVTRELERNVILKSLQANQWNRKQVARALGISYRGLLNKIRDANLSPSQSASPQHTSAAAQ
jgi:two-component system, NtrC family, response regulator AtoC